MAQPTLARTTRGEYIGISADNHRGKVSDFTKAGEKFLDFLEKN